MEDLAIAGSASGDMGFWQGKRVLLTGHTGFKGAWMAFWLHRLGAEVTGVSLPPATAPNLFELADIKSLCHSNFCDIRESAVADLIKVSQPEIVFHLAAQSLVRAGYREPLKTFATNVMGSAHVLDALRGLESVRVAVMVTTDKVYRNNEWPWPYRENDMLGGEDPYSASKAASEIVIAGYRAAFLSERGVAVASARAGNVIGGGDWSEDRLIPDAVRAWQRGDILQIRRPQAVRPWQHVLEPLAGYLTLAEKLWDRPDLAGAFNFGPPSDEVATVRDVVELASAAYGKGQIGYQNGSEGPHEAGWLGLDASKARTVLGLRSKWRLAESVARTLAWYRSHADGACATTLCHSEIDAYEAT